MTRTFLSAWLEFLETILSRFGGIKNWLYCFEASEKLQKNIYKIQIDIQSVPFDFGWLFYGEFIADEAHCGIFVISQQYK